MIFKKEKEQSDLEAFQQLYREMQDIGKILAYEVMKKNLDYSDVKVQTFMPIALSFTNFDWLELIAENEFTKSDQFVIKMFIEKCKHLYVSGEKKLNEEVFGKWQE